MYKLGVVSMLLTFLIILIAVYVLFISDMPLILPWTMFWHFTLILTGLGFKISYVLVLASNPEGNV